MVRLKRLLSRFFLVFDEPLHRWLLLLAAFILTSLLDVVGIGAMGIFIQAVIDPQALEKMQLLPEFVRNTSAHSDHGILVIGIACFVFFALRTVVGYVLQLYVLYFTSRKQVSIQEKLFSEYLRAPFLFRKNRNFTKMLYNVNFLTEQFINRFAISFFTFSTNLLLFVVIAIFLAVTHLLASAVICLIFIAAAGLYYLLIKDRSTRYGNRLAEANELLLKNVREGIGALDEVQILGCHDYFQRKVTGNLEMSLKYKMGALVLHLIPRPLAEFLLLGFIILFTLGYQLYFGSITEISSLIGIFGMAGIRLVPAASQLSTNLNSMKNSIYSVHQLFAETQALREARGGLGKAPAKAAGAERIAFKNRIEIRGVTYAYPGAKGPVLANFNATIAKGERVAIVGKSGSGKTTLMNVLLGNLLPTTGGILVDGTAVNPAVEEWRSRIFYLPQSIFLLDDTIRRNIALGVEEPDIDQRKLQWAVERAQLAELVAGLPEGLETVVGEHGARLSGGQRQRIGIARALYHQREIIIMDEATSALDDETEAEVKESIRNLPRDVTVIMITHNLKEDDIFGHIIKLG